MRRTELKRNLWIRNLREGDIVKAPSGLLRVVRRVEHFTNVSSITFVIKHCSWTRRCYTVMTSHDLISMGYRPTGKRYKFSRKLDREIKRNLINYDTGKQTLTCCDVEGIS